MSRYSFVNDYNNRLVHYGLDLPTGGYFFTEFFTDKEIEERELSDEVSLSKESLTFTEFLQEIKSNFPATKLDLQYVQLVRDYKNDPDPTPLQHNINLLFGKDLNSMLDKLKNDMLGYSTTQ